MEKLYLNLSEEEFSKSRKILLWVFAAAFFLGGVYVLIASPVLGMHQIVPTLSLAPFGIAMIVGIIAGFATVKRKDRFFLIDDDKIEFRYGLFNPRKRTFFWSEISKLVMPHKDKKAKLIMKNGSSNVINLTWIQKKKTGMIRKHIYHTALYKNLNVVKVMHLK
jgi:hypothetical protein